MSVEKYQQNYNKKKQTATEATGSVCIGGGGGAKINYTGEIFILNSAVVKHKINLARM